MPEQTFRLKAAIDKLRRVSFAAIMVQTGSLVRLKIVSVIKEQNTPAQAFRNGFLRASAMHVFPAQTFLLVAVTNLSALNASSKLTQNCLKSVHKWPQSQVSFGRPNQYPCMHPLCGERVIYPSIGSLVHLSTAHHPLPSHSVCVKSGYSHQEPACSIWILSARVAPHLSQIDHVFGFLSFQGRYFALQCRLRLLMSLRGGCQVGTCLLLGLPHLPSQRSLTGQLQLTNARLQRNVYEESSEFAYHLQRSNM